MLEEFRAAGAFTFGTKRFRPPPGRGSPSWLTFLGHMKDSLYSVDLFRCESLTLKTHWVMLVMDQFSRAS